MYNDFANELFGPEKKPIKDLCIEKEDEELKEILFNEELKVYKSYSKCNNEKYIVLKYNDNDYIYILDNCFVEISKIKLNLPVKYKGNIISIACCNCKIYIALRETIISITFEGEFIKEEINSSSLNKINSSTCLDNCLKKDITYSCKNIKVNKPCITSIACICDVILITYEQNGSSFIARLTLKGNLVSKKYIDDNIVPKCIIDTKCAIYVLAKKDCSYEYIYKYSKINGNCKNNYQYCEIIFNSECRVDIECNDLPCDLDGCLCEVIRSIALIEKALAKLICTEGEKIKNAIENDESNKELIKVNDSVAKTIMNITYLEQVLKEKLETALCIYECEYHKKPCICKDEKCD